MGKSSKTEDREYRGKRRLGETEILVPGPLKKSISKYQVNKLRKLHCRRAAIEPVMGHMKQDQRLSGNFYKGIAGDNIHIMHAAAAFNSKRMMNRWKSSFIFCFQSLFRWILFNKNLSRKLNKIYIFRVDGVWVF